MIESKLTLRAKVGSIDTMAEVPGGVSRFLKLEVHATSGTSIFFRDYSSAEAAEKVLSEEWEELEIDYDPSNEEHERIRTTNNISKEDAIKHGWKLASRRLVREYWDGYKTVEPPLQEREVKLTTELALQLAASALKGVVPDQPSNALAAMISQAYLAAVATGEFPDARAI